MKSKHGHLTRIFALSGVLLGGAVASGAATAEPQQQARQILDATGIKGGIVVHLGCGEGRLTAALRVSDAFLVRGLDEDDEQIRKAREYIRSEGLYGSVSVGSWQSARLPFADNLVNLVVAEETPRIPREEIMRVLAPRGVAFVKRGGEWTKTVKPWPQEIDEWTHALHDASNNAVAEDTRVGPPRQIQWTAAPEWARSHEMRGTLHTLVSAGGRIFAIMDEGITGQRAGVPSEWKLVARDAFNGKLLWKRPASRIPPSSLVASGDRVYVPLAGGEPVSILDAASGETLASCENTVHAEEILCHQGIVVCRIADRKAQRRSSGEQSQGLVAVDGQSGKRLWDKQDKVDSLAANGDRICYHNGAELVCLTLDGDERWRTSCEKNDCVVLVDDVVLLVGGKPIEAFSATTGEPLWNGALRSRQLPGIFAAGGMVWSAWPHGEPHPVGRTMNWEPCESVRNGYDVLTGEVKKTVSVERLVTPGHHIRCYRPKATSRYLLLNKRGVEFFDLEGDNHMRHDWLRPDCGYGAMPANGLLYVPPNPCFCYPGVKISGFNALTAGASLAETAGDEADRLVRGPAWAAEIPSRVGVNDRAWPTYRHDPQRSGCVDFELPERVACRWETRLGGKLSPPVAADGKLFVAAIDAHAVECLDAESGAPLWSYTTDARIDSPPTIYQGRVLFGSTDGHVYCLRASDGALVWRFRAAPGSHQIGVREQIESAWPAHGSVLIFNGMVYVTAGRSSHLDGGIRLYALDPETGEVLHQRQLENPRPDVSREAGRPFDMEGARSDILVAGEQYIHLFQEQFHPDLTSEPTLRMTKMGDQMGELHLISTGGFLDRQRSDGAFNRLFWSYGKRWPGFYFAYAAPKSGQIVVFDEETTYSVKYYTERHGHSPEFRPGSGYKLYADRNTAEPTLRPTRAGEDKGRGFTRQQFWKWFREVPVRVEAMVLAADRLYLAGPPDLEPEQESADAMRGLKGSRFWVVATSDGTKISEIEMEKAPVFDGLIAAFGRLYMVTQDGTIMCLGSK
jgi:outer membrane protein assembly factor BamB